MAEMSEDELRMWERLSWSAVVVFSGVGIWWSFRLPTVGKGGLLLAMGATLMPLFLDKIASIGKMAWIAMLFILLSVEYRAIDSDREKNEETQRKELTKIGEGFQGVLTQQQSNFTALMQTSQTNFKTLIESEQVNFERMLANSRKAEQRENANFSDVLNREEALFKSTEELFESLNGQLIPANDPTPKTGCGTLPKGNYIAVVDGGGYMFTRFPHVVVSLHRQKAIWLDKKPDGSVALFMDVRGADGAIAIRIDKDGFFINPKAALYVRRPDKSTILIQNEKGDDVLVVKYVNPEAFLVTEHFANPLPHIGCVKGSVTTDLEID
jgi:hypothetical protein